MPGWPAGAAAAAALLPPPATAAMSAHAAGPFWSKRAGPPCVFPAPAASGQRQDTPVAHVAMRGPTSHRVLAQEGTQWASTRFVARAWLRPSSPSRMCGSLSRIRWCSCQCRRRRCRWHATALVLMELPTKMAAWESARGALQSRARQPPPLPGCRAGGSRHGRALAPCGKGRDPLRSKQRL